MNVLKPCPFCGAEAIVMQSTSPYISCEKGHEFSPRNNCTVDELINQYNKRVDGDSIEYCRGMIDTLDAIDKLITDMSYSLHRKIGIMHDYYRNEIHKQRKDNAEH